MPRDTLYVNDLSQAARVADDVSFACPRALYRDVIDDEYSEFAGSHELTDHQRGNRLLKWACSRLDERLIERAPDYDRDTGDKFAVSAADDAVAALETYDPVSTPYERLLQIRGDTGPRRTAIADGVHDHIEAFARTWYDAHDGVPRDAVSAATLRENTGPYTFDRDDLTGIAPVTTTPDPFTVRGVPDYRVENKDTVTLGEVKTGDARGQQHDMVELFSYLVGAPEPLDRLAGELVYAPDGPIITIDPSTNTARHVNRVADAVRQVQDLTALFDDAGAVPGNAEACWNCDYNNPDNAQNTRLNERYGCPED